MRYSKLFNAISVAIIVMLAVMVFANIMYAVPYGPDTMENLTSSYRDPVIAAKDATHNRSTINTVQFNVTQNTLKWKAYVGNITGALSLDDSSGNTIYDWGMASIDGEVYATIKSTTVTWGSIICANDTVVNTEQTGLNHTHTAIDAINNTFNETTHTGFSVGTTAFATNDCDHSAWLFRNDAPNVESWSETLLYDGGNIVYAAVINESTAGYNNDPFDFQMIVAENGSIITPAPKTYYFYVELT